MCVILKYNETWQGFICLYNTHAAEQVFQFCRFLHVTLSPLPLPFSPAAPSLIPSSFRAPSISLSSSSSHTHSFSLPLPLFTPSPSLSLIHTQAHTPPFVLSTRVAYATV